MNALQRRPEDGEVVRLAPRARRRAPCRPRVPSRRRARARREHLLPVAAGDTDQARVVGVVVELRFERRELVEEPADLVGGEALVRDPGERGRHLRERAAAPCGSIIVRWSSRRSPRPSRGRRPRPAAASDPSAPCSPGRNLPVASESWSDVGSARTDARITVVGIGTAPIGSGRGGSTGAARTSARRSVDQAALAAGANWIDTAPFYGWGRAEEIVRRALESRRDDVLLFSKCGTVPDAKRVSRMDNRPETIRADLEQTCCASGSTTSTCSRSTTSTARRRSRSRGANCSGCGRRERSAGPGSRIIPPSWSSVRRRSRR